MAFPDLAGIDLEAVGGSDAQEDEHLRDIQDGVEGAGDEDDFAGLLLGALAADSVLSQGLAALGRESVGEGKGEEGKDDVSTNALLGLLGITLQAPSLLEFAKRRVFDQAAQVVEIENGPGRGNRQAGEEDFFLAERVRLALPAQDNPSIEGIADEILAIGLLGLDGIAVLIERGEVGYSDHRDLALAPFPPAASVVLEDAIAPLPDDTLAIGFLAGQGLGIGGNVHLRFAGHHEVEAEGVFAGPQIGPVEEAPIDQENPQDPRAEVTDRLADQVQGVAGLVFVDRHDLGRHDQAQMHLVDDKDLEAVNVLRDFDDPLLFGALFVGFGDHAPSRIGAWGSRSEASRAKQPLLWVKKP
jgi:hypothetical protein